MDWNRVEGNQVKGKIRRSGASSPTMTRMLSTGAAINYKGKIQQRYGYAKPTKTSITGAALSVGDCSEG
jgi:uncharacterized protein YjbJ (UPF0337 family)